MGIRESFPKARQWVRAALGVFALAFLVVWVNTEATRMERQLIPMRKEADRLRYENARLQIQLNQWLAPSHMDVIARQEMGLQPVDPQRLIGLEPR